MKKGEQITLKIGKQTVRLKVVAVYNHMPEEKKAALRRRAAMSMDEEMLEANR